MNQVLSMFDSIKDGFSIVAPTPKMTRLAFGRIDENVAEVPTALGGLTAGTPQKAIAELPRPLSIYKFIIPSTTMKSITSDIASQQVILNTDKHPRRSPLWIKTASMAVFLLLAAGVVATLFNRNAFTAALVPLGFTLWAVLVSVIRSRDVSH